MRSTARRVARPLPKITGSLAAVGAGGHPEWPVTYPGARWSPLEYWRVHRWRWGRDVLSCAAVACSAGLRDVCPSRGAPGVLQTHQTWMNEWRQRRDDRVPKCGRPIDGIVGHEAEMPLRVLGVTALEDLVTGIAQFAACQHEAHKHWRSTRCSPPSSPTA